MRALFISHNLVGDGLYIGPALKAWQKENPEAWIYIETDDNYIRPIYSRMGVPVNGVMTKDGTDRLRTEFDVIHKFDVNQAFAISDQKKIHIAEAYAEMIGVKLQPRQWNRHLQPIFIPDPEELREDEKGAILISMFSASCSSRQGKQPNKMLPWETWKVILRYLRTLNLPLRFIGGKMERAWGLDISEEEYLLGVSLNRTALIMRECKVCITLDNGMSHLAASQETPTLLFYPKCLGLHYILPIGNPNMAYLHMDPVQLHPVDVVTVMKETLPLLFESRKVSRVEGITID